MKMKHGTADANKPRARRAPPPFQPGGTPSVTAGITWVEMEVANCPPEMVIVTVNKVGRGEIVGKAVALMLCPRIGLYVLVASPVATTPPTGAEIEELSAYGGVVYVRFGKTQLGNVVVIVADSDAKKEEMTAEVSVVFVPLLSEYNPIIGDSLVLIPKLEICSRKDVLDLKQEQTHLKTVQTVLKNADPSVRNQSGTQRAWRDDKPICQSKPSELGGVAFGHDKHKSGLPDTGPMR